jgi:hypothetical protein
VAPSEVAARFPGAVKTPQGWRARCPHHHSRSRSVAISESDLGNTLIKCHAGCDVNDILDTVGLEMADLFAESLDRQYQPRVRREPTADDVRDEIIKQAERYRAEQGIAEGEEFVAADLNEIRRRATVATGVALAPVPRMVADSHCAGHERDPLWPLLLNRAWARTWIEYSGDLPCCGIEQFASHGRIGYDLLEVAERLAAADIVLIARRQAQASEGV